MGILTTPRQFIVAAVFALVGFSIPLGAETTPKTLLDSLKGATEAEAGRIDRTLQAQWSRSGSASMDLLLRRGRESLESENTAAAIEHFTALTDHAPDFAEGWHGLARAYFAAEMLGPALDALERVLALNPDQYEAIFGLGMLLIEFGDTGRAETAFRKVLSLHPHHEEAKQALKRLEALGIGRTL